jgi:hypothetical protein
VKVDEKTKDLIALGLFESLQNTALPKISSGATPYDHRFHRCAPAFMNARMLPLASFDLQIQPAHAPNMPRERALSILARDRNPAALHDVCSQNLQ